MDAAYLEDPSKSLVSQGMERSTDLERNKKENEKEKENEREDEEQYKEWLKKMRGWLLVVAVLIATCAYTASLSPPGGFWQDDSSEHVAGTSILEDKSVDRFVIFRLFNSIALAQSFAVIIIVMRKTTYAESSKSLVRALQILVVGSIAAVSVAHATIIVSYYYFKINVPYLVVIFLIVAQFITWLQPPFSKLSRWIKLKLEIYYVKTIRPEERGTRVVVWIIVHVLLRLGVIVGILILSVEDSKTSEYWGNKYYKTGLFLLVPFGILLWWFDK